MIDLRRFFFWGGLTHPCVPSPLDSARGSGRVAFCMPITKGNQHESNPFNPFLKEGLRLGLVRAFHRLVIVEPAGMLW